MTKDRNDEGPMSEVDYAIHIIRIFGASRRFKSRNLQVKLSHEVVTGDLVDFQVVLVPSQVVNANPSDSQV